MEKTCSTRYGNAMKSHTSVPFRAFRALINLNNFVLRQVTHNGKRWNSSDISSEKVQASISIHNFLPCDKSDAGTIQLRNWAPILYWLGGKRTNTTKDLFIRDRTTSSSLRSTPHSIVNTITKTCVFSWETNKHVLPINITSSWEVWFSCWFILILHRRLAC